MLVEIDDGIIKRLEKAHKENGYDIPETKEGWSDVIEDYLETKILEDFGEVRI